MQAGSSHTCWAARSLGQDPRAPTGRRGGVVPRQGRAPGPRAALVQCEVLPSKEPQGTDALCLRTRQVLPFPLRTVYQLGVPALCEFTFASEFCDFNQLVHMGSVPGAMTTPPPQVWHEQKMNKLFTRWPGTQ